MIADDSLKIIQKETMWMFFRWFLEIAWIMALVLFINDKGNSTSLEKSMESTIKKLNQKGCNTGLAPRGSPYTYL